MNKRVSHLDGCALKPPTDRRRSPSLPLSMKCDCVNRQAKASMHNPLLEELEDYRRVLKIYADERNWDGYQIKESVDKGHAGVIPPNIDEGGGAVPGSGVKIPIGGRRASHVLNIYKEK